MAACLATSAHLPAAVRPTPASLTSNPDLPSHSLKQVPVEFQNLKPTLTGGWNQRTLGPKNQKALIVSANVPSVLLSVCYPSFSSVSLIENEKKKPFST